MRSFLSAAVVAAAFFGGSAWAQQACGDRMTIVDRLQDDFQEHRHASGVAANGNLAEIFVAATGTWTIVVSRPGGPSCVVATGEGWQYDNPERFQIRGDDV